MRKDGDPGTAHEEASQPGAAVEETLPQWQPPASATRAGVSGTRTIAGHAGVASPAHGDPPVALANTMNAVLMPSGPPEPLPIGAIIGERYVLEKHISSGGFGAVYRAQDRQIENHHVALKLLHQPAADAAAREAALRELTLIASVSHPSIVQFKDYGWYEGRLWFAMPWYQGQTLDKRYGDSAGLLPIKRSEARPIFERLAQGLAAMHQVGIHHHDIKPENVFLADIAGFDAGLPVLLDLGIAGKRGEGPRGLTVEYASPETAAAALGKRDVAVGSAADVFSLALVLRNLLEPETMQRPEGELLAVLHRRASNPVSLPQKRELRYLRPAFGRWLSLDPSERPSASELASEFALLTAPEEHRAAQKRLLRRVLPIVAAAAAAVALLVIQVRKQKSEIIVQQQRLAQEIQQADQLRQRSQAQLEDIEHKSDLLGSQDEQLKKTLGIARELDGALQKAEDRADAQTRKLRKMTDERDGLAKERDALTQERDALVATRDRLQRERDDLARARESLSRERDGLAAQRDKLTDERDKLRGQRDDAVRDRDRTYSDLRATQKSLEAATDERNALRKAHASLKDEVGDLRDQVRDLKKDLDRVKDERQDLKAKLARAEAEAEGRKKAK
jgi:serine/threonine protein kinase